MESDRPSRLGEILIRSKRIKPHQLGVALAVQQKKRIPLGRLLVEVDIITPSQLRFALLTQKLLRARQRFFSTPSRLRDMGLDFALRSQQKLEQHLAALASSTPSEGLAAVQALRGERAQLSRGRLARIIENDSDLAARLRSGNF